MIKTYIRAEECVKCMCFYDNNEEGSEVRKAMDEAQIECSNERTYVNTDKPCDCFQRMDGRHKGDN